MTATRSRFAIRELINVEEFRSCERLQKAVWGFRPLDIVPCRMMAVIARNGGLGLGAFDGDVMVGFVFGYPGVRDGRSLHCSHMLAVHPDHAGNGIGFRLKQAQRRAMLRRGCDLIAWTFDPLEGRNAHLNLHRLGAVAKEYWPNLYGATSSVLHSGAATDRLLVRWRLDSPDVARLARRRSRPAAAGGSVSRLRRIDDGLQGGESVPAALRLNEVRYRKEQPTGGDPILDARRPRLALEVPDETRRLRRDHPRLAARWLSRMREAFGTYLARGYVVSDYLRRTEGDRVRSFYILTRETRR